MSVFDEMELDELLANRAAVANLLAKRTPESDPIGHLQYADLLAYIDERIKKMKGKRSK